MKSFSNLLLEKKPLDITNDPKGGEKFLRQLKKRSVQNQTDVKTVDRPAEVQGRMDATDSKKGGYSRVDDSLDNKPSGKTKLGNTTKGGEVKTIKPPGTVSGNESRPLGKLNKKTSKLNFGSNKELQAKRKLRVDTKTGKATPKGVENYAQSRGGYGRTTGKPRNMGKPEWESRKAQAKQIASNPGSKAYKEIENKINTSDYAGKRAKGANPTELKSIKSSIANSKTANLKGGKLNVPRSGNVVPLNTSTRKGKIFKPTVTPTKVVKQSEVSKKAAEFTQKTNQKKIEKTFTPKSTSKYPGEEKYRELLKKTGTKVDGRKFNNPQVNNLTGKKPPKDIANQWINTKDPSGKRYSSPGEARKDYQSGAFKKSNKPQLASKQLASKTPKITGPTRSINLSGKLSSTAAFPKRAKSMMNYKGFVQKANPLLGKTVASKVGKTSVKKVAKGLLKGAGSKVGAGVIDTAYGYNQYRDKGHSKVGSLVRGAIKGGASALGFAGGALAGGLAGGGVASLATGAAGGLAGSAFTSHLADKIIGAVDKKLKLKTPKKYQKDSYKKGKFTQSKITGGGSIPGPGKGSSGNYNFTPLSLGTSTKDYNKGQSAPWKTKKESVEYVQERFRSQAIQTYLKNKAGQQDLTNKANKFKQENPGTDFSKGARMSNPNLTPSSSLNNNSTQQSVSTQTTQARPLGPTQQAAANIDKIASSGPGSGSVRVDGRALMNKLRSDSSNQTQSSTPQAQQAQRPVTQAQRPVTQAQRPVTQAQPQRTVGGQGNRQRPVKTGGIQLGNAIRKPIGSAINAVRSALSNKGPIQGRQTGAQRRAAQTANRPVVTQAPVAKPVQPAPVAKPVTQAPVAKPAPQLTGAQRAQQMAKQRIAQGRNTVTGALKSAKPKPRVTTWRDLE